MPKDYNTLLLEVLQLTRQMMTQADRGDQARIDRGCGVIYGVLRDSAFKLREMTLKEIDQHKSDGSWDIDDI